MTSPPNLADPSGRKTATNTTQEQFRDRPVLEQIETATDTDTTLYTVPKNRMAEVRVWWTENGNATSTVRLWVQKAGAATADKQYLMGGPAASVAVAALEHDSKGPLILGADDVVKVRASTATVSWTANGRDYPRDTP